MRSVAAALASPLAAAGVAAGAIVAAATGAVVASAAGAAAVAATGAVVAATAGALVAAAGGADVAAAGGALVGAAAGPPIPEPHACNSVAVGSMTPAAARALSRLRRVTGRSASVVVMTGCIFSISLEVTLTATCRIA